jgi:hypothetical protein
MKKFQFPKVSHAEKSQAFLSQLGSEQHNRQHHAWHALSSNKTSQRGALGTMDKGAKDVAKMTSLPPSVMI